MFKNEDEGREELGEITEQESRWLMMKRNAIWNGLSKGIDACLFMLRRNIMLMVPCFTLLPKFVKICRLLIHYQTIRLSLGFSLTATQASVLSCNTVLSHLLAFSWMCKLSEDCP